MVVVLAVVSWCCLIQDGIYEQADGRMRCVSCIEPATECTTRLHGRHTRAHCMATAVGLDQLGSGHAHSCVTELSRRMLP